MLQGCNQKDQEKWVDNKSDNRIASHVLFARKPLAYSCGRRTLRCDLTSSFSPPAYACIIPSSSPPPAYTCIIPSSSPPSVYACIIPSLSEHLGLWLAHNQQNTAKVMQVTLEIMLCHLSIHPRPEQEISLGNLRKWGVMLSKPHGKELQVTAWHCRWHPDNSKWKAGAFIPIATRRWILPTTFVSMEVGSSQQSFWWWWSQWTP